VRQLDARLQLLPTLGLELEVPRAVEADRGEDGGLAELWLVVRVPPHTVQAVPIAVEEDAVERHAGSGIDGVLDLHEGRRPRQGLVHDARIDEAGPASPYHAVGRGSGFRSPTSSTSSAVAPRDWVR
jgi:hypothetical protein